MTDEERNTEEGPGYQTEDEEGPVQTKQQEESTDMEMATMVEGRNEPNKEIGINKPTAFDGSRKKVEMFIQECRLYLQVNKKIYATDEAKDSPYSQRSHSLKQNRQGFCTLRK